MATSTPVPDASYTHVQALPSASWDIQHDLNKFPVVVVLDSNDEEVEGEVQYLSASRILLTFTGAFSGRAILN